MVLLPCVVLAELEIWWFSDWPLVLADCLEEHLGSPLTGFYTWLGFLMGLGSRMLLLPHSVDQIQSHGKCRFNGVGDKLYFLRWEQLVCLYRESRNCWGPFWETGCHKCVRVCVFVSTCVCPLALHTSL